MRDTRTRSSENHGMPRPPASEDPHPPAIGGTAGCDPPHGPNAVVAETMLQALTLTDVPTCLCDEYDRIRFANTAFTMDLLDGATAEGDFADALCRAIAAGGSLKFESIDLDAFRLRVRKRRREAVLEPFCVELTNGTWWRIQEHRTAAGWLLTIATNISSLKAEELRLRVAHAGALEAARTDYLTGVANRRWGMEQAQLQLDACAARRRPFTVTLLDLDRFKAINDVHGHDKGDEALIHVAKILTLRLGPRDAISRIGGEEFMVAMPDTPLRLAQQRLERLLRTLPPLQGPGAEPLALAFSAGIATGLPGEALKSILSRADRALYQAKSRGRCRVETDLAARFDAA